jgi:hypothetical protein
MIKKLAERCVKSYIKLYRAVVRGIRMTPFNPDFYIKEMKSMLSRGCSTQAYLFANTQRCLALREYRNFNNKKELLS